MVSFSFFFFFLKEKDEKGFWLVPDFKRWPLPSPPGRWVWGPPAARTFTFVPTDPRAVHITYFRWDVESRRFRASDTYAFARAGKGAAPGAAPAPAPPPAQPVPADTTSHS